MHESFSLIEKFSIRGKTNVRGVKYSPDFCVYNEANELTHVYDIKNSFGIYGIDTSVSLRAKLFEKKYGIPIEFVVIRKNDFKVKVIGTTKKFEPIIKENIDYSWEELFVN